MTRNGPPRAVAALLLILLLPIRAEAREVLGTQRIGIALVAQTGRATPSRSGFIQMGNGIASKIAAWSGGQASYQFTVSQWHTVSWNPCNAKGQAILDVVTEIDWKQQDAVIFVRSGSGCYGGAEGPSAKFPYKAADGSTVMLYIVTCNAYPTEHMLAHELFHCFGDLGHANRLISGFPVSRSDEYGEHSNIMGDTGYDMPTGLHAALLGWATPDTITGSPGTTIIVPLGDYATTRETAVVRRGVEDWYVLERRSGNLVARTSDEMFWQHQTLIGVPLTDPTSGVSISATANGARVTLGDPDLERCQVTWLTPSRGDTVSGTIPVTFEVSDNRPGHGDATLWSNAGLWRASLSGPPWTTSFNTTLSPDGSNLIMAWVRDAAGNITPTQLPITVKNHALIDPTASSVPATWVVCPAGDIPDTVVVRDDSPMHRPMPGVVVNAQLVWTVGEFQVCGGTGGYLSLNATTDANGVAVFRIPAGGQGRVDVAANGVRLHEWGTLFTASPDANGDGVVNLDDGVLWTSVIKHGLDVRWSDLNADGVGGTLADAVLLTAHLKLGHQCGG